LLERFDHTVHAAAMSALQKTDIGYRFYFAVYVQRVSWITAISMALIDPFRRWIVYSAIFKQIERSWTAHFGPTNLHNRDSTGQNFTSLFVAKMGTVLRG